MGSGWDSFSVPTARVGSSRPLRPALPWLGLVGLRSGGAGRAGGRGGAGRVAAAAESGVRTKGVGVGVGAASRPVELSGARWLGAVVGGPLAEAARRQLGSARLCSARLGVAIFTSPTDCDFECGGRMCAACHERVPGIAIGGLTRFGVPVARLVSILQEVKPVLQQQPRWSDLLELEAER